MRPLALASAVALSLAVLAFPPPARAAPGREVASHVDAVTVHRTSARVTRLAEAEVSEGEARLVLAGLPDGLDDDSLRVEGKGSARVRLLGVEVERVTGERAAAAEARAAEERLEALAEEDRALEDRLRVAQARQKFVEGLRSTYSEERARNLAVRPVSAREWAELTSFVEKELAAASAEARRAEAGRREARRRMDAARAALEALAAKRAATTKRVVIALDASRAGTLQLAVAYTVANAGWGPVWDARLDPAASKVELELHGSVWQRTGEDWSGVRLAVSTAAPERRLLVPELSTAWLDRAHPVAVLSAKRTKGAQPEAAAPAALALRAPRERADADEVAAEVPQAELADGPLAVTLTAPARATVDGSGQARRVLLSRVALDAEVTRTAAPRVDRAAFLTAKMVNGSALPILPGTASVWVGDAFAGRAPVAATPPGGELRLAFGADDRVEVERRVLERTHDTSGLLGKRDVWRYRVRTTVKNRRGEPVKLALQDLVPVARDGEIEVKVLGGTTAGAREDVERPGVRTWELALAAREERVVELRWEVSAPQGLALAGLD
ncbi:MAG TPA: DUF4139 domain-containing protein [Anaeromyxobacteraceae bacterium]|nr:DUF4139 domain-containing protein [Anaeromyxobacteraceae bacterium]